MSKRCVFMFGRMNPCHLGHGRVFEKALQLQDSTTDVKLFLSASFDPKKNPLPREVRQYYISEFFPEIKDSIQDTNINNLFDIMKSLDTYYSDVIFVGGSDRASSFQELLLKYNNKQYSFDSISTVLAGTSREESMFSSTLMRNAVQKDDFSTFKICLPGDNEYLKYDMFAGVKKYMKNI